MPLPFFYINNFDRSQTSITLDENNSRHAVQVLRMKTGEDLHLVDGNGHLITATIISDHKKHCEVSIKEVLFTANSAPDITIAISPVKNANRFEWFLEKATELGIRHIIPLLCERTEKERYKEERLHNILVSAMLQSQQVWLPRLAGPAPFKNIIATAAGIPNKYIAHCLESSKETLSAHAEASVILIGPEGDFTPAEIEQALAAGFKPVTLGSTRLRTETAGVVAATLMKLG